ncbi:MAG TPA: hypothetical protein VMH00_05260 [Candidatus Limnocylindrales bacterium]|nr:hypothetical protein [Candidatus Limnocylindrales bacterium]
MRRFAAASLPALLVLAAVCSSLARSATQRVDLAPRFAPGDMLRYRIATSTSSNEHTISPIINPEGGSEFKQNTNFLVRLDVLASPSTKSDSGSAPASGSVRFRATFEKSHAISETDAFAPAADTLDDDIDKLEGRSIEFTLGSAGEITGVTGLDQITTDPAAAQRVLSWTSVLSAPSAFPKDRLEVGRKWDAERTLTGLPLTGVIWHSESSYLRNEPCAPSSAASAKSETCAVILTRFEISRRGKDHSDATPENYIHNGLRTSGSWTGSGESLNSISLSSGFLVSSTQTATQDMDYEILSASSGSHIRHVGHTKTQTEITLVAASASVAPSAPAPPSH